MKEREVEHLKLLIHSTMTITGTFLWRNWPIAAPRTSVLLWKAWRRRKTEPPASSRVVAQCKASLEIKPRAGLCCL
jgi:hypothetical protein